MSVFHIDNTKAVLFEGNGASKVSKKSMLGPFNGWNDYVMRFFEIEPGGYTPKHKHPWPQYMFVVEGQGDLDLDGTIEPIEFGNAMYVPSNAEHQIVNPGQSNLKFICVVPPEGDK